MTSTLVAIEGASGVGKSTLVKELLKRNPHWIGVPSLNFPRERDKALEVVGNSASDYLCLATAMSHANATVIADRGFLGHWVYEAYKEGPRDNWTSRFIESIENLENMFHTEACARWRDMKHIIERPNIHIIVLTPSESQLEYQRIMAKKEYPYNENELYRNMALELEWYPNQMYLQCTVVSKYDEEYIEKLIARP